MYLNIMLKSIPLYIALYHIHNMNNKTISKSVNLKAYRLPYSNPYTFRSNMKMADRDGFVITNNANINIFLKQIDVYEKSFLLTYHIQHKTTTFKYVIERFDNRRTEKYLTQVKD